MGVLIAICLFTVSLAMPSAAAGLKTVTFCSDGALVEIEAQAVRGRVTVPLPDTMLDGTLIVTPRGSARLVRVETVAVPREGKREQELNRLEEQKERMQDRLRALATREEIYTAAAKSQSGKAPRKTKANPDPIRSIRQGTDFAIAQLEEVYASRRRTEQEVRRIEARLAALRRGDAGAARMASISVQPPGGRVWVRYATAAPGWTPRYDLRIAGSGPAQLTLYADLPDGFGGYSPKAAFGTLSTFGGEAFLVDALQGARLAEYRLEAKDTVSTEGLRPAVSFFLANDTRLYFPPGQAALFYQGEYRGSFRFDGLSSGRSRRITLGH